MEDFNIELMGSILSVVLFLLAAFASAKWKQAKTTINGIRQLVVAVDDAFEDDKVSDGEVRLIINKLRQLCNI